MSQLLSELLKLHSLEQIASDVYRGASQDLGWGRVYGGQVLGQAMVAAGNTIQKRAVHAMHAYFLRPGDTQKTIEYQVERVRDGGSFSVRRVVALQGKLPIFVTTCSFQTPEDGLEHQIPMPSVPGPEGLKSELEMRREVAHLIPENLRAQYVSDRPIEVRHVSPMPLLKPERREPQKQSWMRVLGKMPADPMLNKCLLAYMSDWGILGTSLYPHALSVSSRDMQVASLDHAMWFHHDVKVDEWLLYVQDSPSSSQSRGLGRGHFFTQAGKLVATVAQEGLIRKRPTKSNN